MHVLWNQNGRIKLSSSHPKNGFCNEIHFVINLCLIDWCSTVFFHLKFSLLPSYPSFLLYPSLRVSFTDHPQIHAPSTILAILFFSGRWLDYSLMRWSLTGVLCLKPGKIQYVYIRYSVRFSFQNQFCNIIFRKFIWSMVFESCFQEIS